MSSQLGYDLDMICNISIIAKRCSLEIISLWFNKEETHFPEPLRMVYTLHLSQGCWCCAQLPLLACFLLYVGVGSPQGPHHCHSNIAPVLSWLLQPSWKCLIGCCKLDFPESWEVKPLNNWVFFSLGRSQYDKQSQDVGNC